MTTLIQPINDASRSQSLFDTPAKDIDNDCGFFVAN
jgi:hypothetical protein